LLVLKGVGRGGAFLEVTLHTLVWLSGHPAKRPQHRSALASVHSATHAASWASPGMVSGHTALVGPGLLLASSPPCLHPPECSDATLS
jgi:hypothetical protein